ncbi:hypothetical protein BUV99_13350, partial [Corynebacterium diphtheriae]
MTEGKYALCRKALTSLEIWARSTVENSSSVAQKQADYANAAWQFMNEVDPLVYNKEMEQIDAQVRQPARKLSTDWRINVKMTDSVTEGKYA